MVKVEVKAKKDEPVYKKRTAHFSINIEVDYEFDDEWLRSPYNDGPKVSNSVSDWTDETLAQHLIASANGSSTVEVAYILLNDWEILEGNAVDVAIDVEWKK